MRQLFAAVVLLVCVGCATQAKYQQYVNNFVGQNADRLYAIWGAPVRSAPLPEGGQVVSFLSNIGAGGGLGGPGFVTGCETTFMLDRGGMVRQGTFRGNACYS